MKKKGIIIGSLAAVATAAAGVVAFKNRDKIKGKIKECKCKKCNKDEKEVAE